MSTGTNPLPPYAHNRPAIRHWFHAQWVTLRSATRYQWGLFLAGMILLGAGIGGGLLPSELGAGPADALFAGAADITPVTVGTWAIAISILLVVFAWLLGQQPLLGTILSLFLFGVVVDIAFHLAPTFTTLPLQVTQWLIGSVLLAVGAGFTIASGVGASAYDMATVAIANKIGGRLGVARLVLDGTALVIALLIGGPIAWGTVGLMVVFPLIMPRVVRLIRARRASAPAPTSVAD